jgi:pimeloyl-ACP methyl ester carboxylesterase
MIEVEGRQVRYRREGQGSPVVLIYPNSADLGTMIEALAEFHTVFAFDNPGYEGSDPLAGDDITIADLADALAATMRLVGFRRVPVFGTHLGAAIAIELGVRHPDLVAGLVLDGVPIFTAEETEAYARDGYFTVVEPDPLGGQYARCWTRVRDWLVFDPWCRRDNAARRRDGPTATAEALNDEVLRYFRSCPGFVASYRAAFAFGAIAPVRIAALAVPATFTALANDELFAHLDRMPAGQRVLGPAADSADLIALVKQELALLDPGGAPPSDPASVPGSGRVGGLLVDLRHGQIFCHVIGDPRNPPLVVFPDAPGSSQRILGDLSLLADDFHVHAVDPPGTGGSTPLPGARHDLTDHADAMAAFCRAITDRPAILYGIGFGATLAAAVAARHPALAKGLLLRRVVAPDGPERQVLSDRLAPPWTIGAHGEHWYATWLMLRDSLLYDPWFARGPDAVRTAPVDLDPARLHSWTLDVVGAGPHYADLIHAVLAEDVAPLFAGLAVPAVSWRHPHDACTLSGHRAQTLLKDVPLYAGDDLAVAIERLRAVMGR